MPHQPDQPVLDNTPFIATVGMFGSIFSADMKNPIAPSQREIEDVIKILDSCKKTLVIQSNSTLNASSPALSICTAFLLGIGLIVGGSVLLATENENRSSSDHIISAGMVVGGGLTDILAFMVCCALRRDARQRDRANLILTTDRVGNYLEELSKKEKQMVMRTAAAIGANLNATVTLDAFLSELKNYLQHHFPSNSAIAIRIEGARP